MSIKVAQKLSTILITLSIPTGKLSRQYPQRQGVTPRHRRVIFRPQAGHVLSDNPVGGFRAGRGAHGGGAGA